MSFVCAYLLYKRTFGRFCTIIGAVKVQTCVRCAFERGNGKSFLEIGREVPLVCDLEKVAIQAALVRLLVVTAVVYN